MGAGDHVEPPEGGAGGPARPGGSEPDRSGVDEDRFEVLFECLGGIGEAGAKARGFLETAQQLLGSDAPAVPRRGEVVAYCVRQAADSILDTAGSSSEDQRWEDLSRKAVDAFKEYERERRFTEDGSDAALTDALAGLRAAMGALDRFHEDAPTRSQRRAAAAHARLTGSTAVGEGLDPIKYFLKVRKRAANKLHSTCSVEDAERLLSECVDAMLGFLRSTADKSGELAELAGRASPGSAELEAARRLIITDGDLVEFLGSVADPEWLVLLYQNGLLNLPGGQGDQGGWWAARTAAIRLSGPHRQKVAEWLAGAADENQDDPARGAAVADVLLGMAEPEFDTALRIAERHPRDPSILRHFTRALEGADPSDPIVERCAYIFLNALIPEDQQEERPVYTGRNRTSGDMINLLRMLSDGANQQNAGARIRLLLAKTEGMPLRYGAFSLFPMGRDRRLPISSLVGVDPDELDDEHWHTVGGCLVSISARAMGWLPAAELLEIAKQAPDELAGRLRTWILATSPDADPDAMTAEIEQAVASRSPNSDDIALLDRIAQELGPDALTDRWRAALGDPPTVAEASRALASNGLLPGWRYPYLWSGLLPEAAAEAWAEAPATQILAAQIGEPETRDYYLGLADDPDSDIRAGWVQSPLSADHLRSLSPEDAADEISAWRPQPHDWGHDYQMLARTLQQVVGENPTLWLAEPLPIALRLRHPTYISAYLQGAAKAAADNPDAFEAVPVSGLVDLLTMAQQEPWPAEQLDANSRPNLDYDADWLSVRRAGTDMAKALLDSGVGLAGRDDDVWDYLDAEARTNPYIFEASPISADFAKDPVGYMLDHPEDDNSPSDPLFMAINQAGTRAVDAALSFMAAEYRAAETVRPQAAGLLDWCLRLDGLEGAKHRAIIAPNAARLRHILPDWFEQNHSLLFDDALDRLGQLTVDMAVKWSQPWEWLLVNHRDSIYDSAARGVERALEWLQIAMLFEYDRYGPRALAQRLGGRLPRACGALADVIDRVEQPTSEQMGALREFCDAVIEFGGGQHAAALGRMAYTDALDHDTWTAITLDALEATGGRIGHAHKITERILDNPSTPRGAAILNHLVEVQTNEALARATADLEQDQSTYFDGAWPRRLIADQAADWLAAARSREAAAEYDRLEETLIRHRLLRSGGRDNA